jgi:serine protease Do
MAFQNRRLTLLLLISIVPALPGPPFRTALAKDGLQSASPTVTEIAKKAMPAVVSIQSMRQASAGEKRSLGVGSGVIIREDGLIVTSYHVIEGANRVTVNLEGKGEPLKAKIIAGDSRSDIALLQLQNRSAKYASLKLGDSDRVQVGDPAIAVGNPFGFDHTVTSGIVSARGRNGASMGPFGDPGPDVDDMIQTDAAINPGNSGGPLLNGDGEMVGLNAAIFSQSGAFIGIGFAIPSRVVREITDQLLKNGRVVRGWLGVTAQNLDEHLAKKFKTEARGALISDIRPKGPAFIAGLKPGDIIRSFDKQPVANSPTLKSLASKAVAGKTVEVEYLRDGKRTSAKLLIAEQPRTGTEGDDADAGLAAVEENKPPRSAADLGLTLQNVPADLRGMMGLSAKQGVLVGQVTPGSAAAESGLSPGDVLLSLESEAVASSEEVTVKIARWLKAYKSPDSILLLVQRGPGDKVFIALPGA